MLLFKYIFIFRLTAMSWSFRRTVFSSVVCYGQRGDRQRSREMTSKHRKETKFKNNFIMKKTSIILCVLALITVSYGQAIKSQNLESIKIKKSKDGNIIMERIGNSIYIHFYEKETRRYMDITPLMSPDEFIRISNRIAAICYSKEEVQKPALDYWRYDHNLFGRIATSHELSPYWDPYPRYDIDIDAYSFVYYPKGNNVDIKNYWLDIWNFNVPDYQENHVYVRVVYDHFTDIMTDEELFETSEIQIKKLQKL